MSLLAIVQKLSLYSAAFVTIILPVNGDRRKGLVPLDARQATSNRRARQGDTCSFLP